MLFSPKNIFKKRTSPNNIDLINYLKNFNYRNIKICNLRYIEHTLTGDILKNNRIYRIDYMNTTIRDFTKVLSEELRDINNKNIYYNIKSGVITVFI
jgi:hypothetical protein